MNFIGVLSWRLIIFSERILSYQLQQSTYEKK